MVIESLVDENIMYVQKLVLMHVSFEKPLTGVTF